MRRRSGVLLHPTSLPGPFGGGDLGPHAERFLAWLAAAGQTLWQVLPLGPHGPSSSPYGAWSAFAGNPLLLSPERLLAQGLVAPGDLERALHPSGSPDLAAATGRREGLLRAAWANHAQGGGEPALRSRLEQLAADGAVGPWLEDWSLFAALKASLDGAPWYRWPQALRDRDESALAACRRELADEISYQHFVQLLFFEQWTRLRSVAADLGIGLVGDLAIYVALDSADVWTHRRLFDLDEEGQPRHVAGVPPDYFSSSGQRWGNPLYQWDRLASEGYRWWIDRIGWSLRLFDCVRLDHFRGFAAYWEIPSAAEGAAEGLWRPGPGRSLFDAVASELGPPPIVAEDLGVITDEVRALRRELGFPGMRVLQFAFGDPGSEHLPHRFDRNVVVYTGTHDNNTSRGWFEAASEAERARALDYLGGSREEIHWSMIRAATTSVADTAIIPIQDLLGLGSEGRMNHPGKAEGQWLWRLTALPEEALARRLRRLTEIAGRLPEADVGQEPRT